MKLRLIAVICCLALLGALCACSAQPEATQPEATEAATEATQTPEIAAADTSAWNWVKGELDCFDYSTDGEDCYFSFEYPDCFQTKTTTDSGEQSFSCWYDPNDPDAVPNTSSYNITVYFMQGGYGPWLNTMNEDFDGGMTQRELGGRTVYFGEYPQSENGLYNFAYYTYYGEEDDWARVWLILAEPEQNGEFRKTFEESMNFTKG